MTNSNVLTQYQSEVIEALKSAANLGKPFEKVIIDTLKLFMAIPDKINFLQMGRYGEFTEQTYRNTFTRDDFDWFAFNLFLANKVEIPQQSDPLVPVKSWPPFPIQSDPPVLDTES